MNRQLCEKLERLQSYLRDLGSVAVAFSGGVDSTFLMKVASDVLGERAIAITVHLHSVPIRELKEAAEFCKEQGIQQVQSRYNELAIAGFCQNPKNRCYICKKEIFREIRRLADMHGAVYIVEGSNMDDMGDYRPGMAAVRESGAKSPLQYAQMTKQDIRDISRELGLATWEKPSFACLASRFPYGETISAEKLKMVEQSEDLLLTLGFRQMRVRIHGTVARIEVLPEDFSKIIQEPIREKIYTALQKYGFQYITLDLKGYRTGSMNEILSKEEKQHQIDKNTKC